MGITRADSWAANPGAEEMARRAVKTREEAGLKEVMGEVLLLGMDETTQPRPEPRAFRNNLMKGLRAS
jgi:hypothetical protein